MSFHTHTARINPTPWRALLAAVALLTLAACGGKNVTAASSLATSSKATATTSQDASVPAVGPSNPPPGLPSDWSAQAIRAATASFQTCAQANSLQPPHCPQQVQEPLGGGNVVAVHWTALNQPLDHAVAVPVQQEQSGGTTVAGQVAVYGLYQIDVSYTTSGQSLRPYLDYTGGIAEATMTWDGHSFQNVAFTSGPVTKLPAAVTMPPFSRPSGVSDDAALQAVRAGFQDCVALKVTPAMTAPPDCPQNFYVLDPYFVDLQAVLNGDPMQGALVSFDTGHGNFAVTGSFNMTLNTIRRVPGQADEPQTRSSSGNYTATLAWDGHQLMLLNIAAT